MFCKKAEIADIQRPAIAARLGTLTGQALARLGHGLTLLLFAPELPQLLQFASQAMTQRAFRTELIQKRLRAGQDLGVDLHAFE
jgi:hypothetical protein